MMNAGELTLAGVFKANGRVIPLFGKWHLGDDHACRPHNL